MTQAATGAYKKPDRAPDDLAYEVVGAWWKLEEELEKVVKTIPKFEKTELAKRKTFETSRAIHERAANALYNARRKVETIQAAQAGLPKKRL